MKAEDHPEYEVEKNHLDYVLDTIDRRILSLGAMTGTAGDPYAQDGVRKILREEIRDLTSARPSPFFGRIDFQQSGSNRQEEWYIGRTGIDNTGPNDILVLDWRAPASSLFYTKSSTNVSYRSPRGVERGDIMLKRRYEVSEACLQDISDEVDSRVTSGRLGAAIMDPDSYLRDVLSGTKDAWLKDIVATIQAQQDQIIRSPHDRILFLQGVAGSGKTVVALHRLAYLLYPGNSTGIKARRVLVLGPNPLFLHYISRVLPGLRIDGIRQVTFNDWALDQIGLGHYKTGRNDNDYESVSKSSISSEERGASMRRGRLKGSLKVTEILREFVERKRGAISIPRGGWTFSVHGIDLSVSAQELALGVYSTRNLPLEVQRKRVIENLVQLLAEKYRDGIKKVPSDLEGVRKTLNGQIDRSLSMSWEPISFPDDYYRLLASPSMLQTISSSILSHEEISDLQTTPAPRKGTIHAEDIPALHYLYGLLYGWPKVSYDHVLIDEAQDLAPVQLKIISAHVPNHSMTVVGDINQAIYANRGIQSWTEFEEAVQGVPFDYIEMTRNYRSTFEITTFANRMLMAFRESGTTPAEPFDRHGPAPALISAASADEVLNEVIDVCATARRAGFRTIAVVCKTLKQCKELAKRLKERNVSDAVVVETNNYTLEKGLMLIPVYLTKGLEFDVVVLAQADSKTYTYSREDAKVLYVALTRALHQLHIVWTGELSPLLTNIQDVS